MPKNEIVIDFKLNGQIEVSVQGTKGASCVKETEDLQKLLGKTTSTTLTKEYYQKEDKEDARRTITNRR